MISHKSLRNIIRISTQPLDMWSPASEELLLMTAAHESRNGTYTKQVGGPALGLYQMEPDTLLDNYVSYLDYRKELKEKIVSVAGVSWYDLSQLQYNPIYATIHARIKYYRDSRPLPPAHDSWSLACYAKDVFNSHKGAATPEKYFNAYRDLVLV